MKKTVAVTIEIDTDVPGRDKVTGFKVNTGDYEFDAESVPFSIIDAMNMLNIALTLINEKE